MLKLKWLMLTLSSTFLLTIPTTSNAISFQPTMQIAENEAKTNGMIQVDNLGLIISPTIDRLEKDRIEFEKKKSEEEILKKEQEINRGYDQVFIVSYYGATYSECGNSHFVTASGVPVQEGHIAVPKEIPFGSKVIIDGTEYLATDRGNPNYIKTLKNGNMKVDVFVPRLDSEINNDYKYEKRIAKMGIRKVVGKLLMKG